MSVTGVLRALAAFPERQQLLVACPDLEVEDLDEVLAFAVAMADCEPVRIDGPAA